MIYLSQSSIPMLIAVSCLSPVNIQILMSAFDRLEIVSGTPCRNISHHSVTSVIWRKTVMSKNEKRTLFFTEWDTMKKSEKLIKICR